MADKLPIKKREPGPSQGLQEFEAGDTIAINAGGTGAVNAVGARTNLGAASETDLTNHVNDTGNPHSVTPAQIGAATATDLTNHINDTGNPHSVTPAQIGAVTTATFNAHVNDTGNPHSTTAAQVGAIPTAEKGAPNGVAELDGSGTVPLSQLPAAATAGDVAGPASATDHAVARFDGTTGKLIQNSSFLVQDNGNFQTDGNGRVGHNFTSPYVLSVQSNSANTYIEILNSAGAGQGAFFGVENYITPNDFALYNWQGGPITFYTDTVVSSEQRRMVIQPDGDVEIKNLSLGVVKSAADGTLSSETENTAFNKDFGTTAGTVAEGNHTHPGLGDIFLATIGGNIQPAFVDTGRGSKTLTASTNLYQWAEAVLSDNDWMQVGHASDSLSGHVMPFNGTIVGATFHCENGNGNAKEINWYLNGALQGTLFTATGAADDIQTSNLLNIDFTAGDKIRMRAGTTGGSIQDTIVMLYVRWRA